MERFDGMPDDAQSVTFAELYQAYARDVYRFALYLSGDRALAEDLTAETFLRVWVSPQPVELSTVKAFLFAIARNLYRHELRHSRRQQPLEDAPSPGSMAGDVETRERLQRVSRSLAGLAEVDRAAVLLRVEGVSYREIAGMLGISEAAAKVKVHRARLRLARENPEGVSHGTV